jgi:hypothetical protein
LPYTVIINKFNFRGGGGEGVKGGVEKKEKELKDQIDMKFSTKFQLNPSTNGCENYIKGDMGTDGPTDKVSYRRASSHLKRVCNQAGQGL